MLDRIQVFGYKRLRDVSVYVGRKTVALVGPNEAGKSSLLSALRLFDNTDAVPASSFSRSLRAQGRDPDEDVVVLWFSLSAEQQKRIRALPISNPPTHYLRHKRVNGQFAFSFHPSPRSKPITLFNMEREMSAAVGIVRSIRGITDDVPDAQFEADVSALQSTEAGQAFDGDAWERVFTDLLVSDDSDFEKTERSVIRSIRDYDQWGRPDRSVSVALRDWLGMRDPSFALFGGPERAISADNLLDDPTTQQSIALANLLEVAELSLEHLRANRTDRAYTRQLLDDANARLQVFFASRWSQEQIAVGLDLDGDNLRVIVKDLRKGSVGWLDITDRSDGLRMFVALATFLARRGDQVPPILLIDEAEQHLHVNAQSDLVRMLQSLAEIQQVIYTTHSPACLPTDIGNGVRFVEPLEDGVSRIRHDFWSLSSNGHIGFNPLLILMGAGAAAFSGLRSALLVEGASDMLLLPTLIKLATGANELDYQIAPGIAVASKADMQRLDLVASRVGFMVDGDPAGEDWRSQLIAAGMNERRVYMLPQGVAIEDLLDRAFYLETLGAFLDPKRPIVAEELGDGPIKGAVEAWGERNKVALPGPVVVVEHILGMHESREREIKLADQHITLLKGIHAWARKTLVAPK